MFGSSLVSLHERKSTEKENKKERKKQVLTRSKDATRAPGRTTRNKDATSNKGHRY